MSLTEDAVVKYATWMVNVVLYLQTRKTMVWCELP